MRHFLDLFTNTAVFVDFAISLLALIVMCALTYAMRWLPGKAGSHKEPAMTAIALKYEAITSKEDVSGRSACAQPRTVAIEKIEVATVE
jgi:hypothetical protein